MTKPITVLKEQTVREFEPIGGKYRVRILQNIRSSGMVLDIREYVDAESFSGFTRRGIRLSDRAQVDHLRDILTVVLKDILM